jgi:hypothetical protein
MAQCFPSSHIFSHNGDGDATAMLAVKATAMAMVRATAMVTATATAMVTAMATAMVMMDMATVMAAATARQWRRHGDAISHKRGRGGGEIWQRPRQRIWDTITNHRWEWQHLSGDGNGNGISDGEEKMEKVTAMATAMATVKGTVKATGMAVVTAMAMMATAMAMATTKAMATGI